MFKLLVYFDLPKQALEKLAAADVEVVRGKRVPSEAVLCEDIAGCDAIIFFEQTERGFNKTIIDAAPKLKLIARRGVGYDSVDWKYAESKGIYVTNTPGTNSLTVAEAAVMLMLECARNAQRVSADFREKRKDYRMFSSDPNTRGFEISGKTLGIVGCGNIGTHVARIAHYGFNMKVIGYDAYAPQIAEYIERVDCVNEVFARADIVSLHMPSTAETRGSIGMEQFRLMKPTSIFINTSRGDVVREEELIQALRGKLIRGAGLDVFSSEPITEKSYELFDLDRVELTPHNASYTLESLYNTIESTVESVIEVAQGKAPRCKVNEPVHPRCAKR